MANIDKSIKMIENLERKNEGKNKKNVYQQITIG